ncbi:hypothetical protein TNCV_417691 [Trichonephila clavipes]|nr:hypothetical protein TNCV_417691 [Trichonephila clavipes]
MLPATDEPHSDCALSFSLDGKVPATTSLSNYTRDCPTNRIVNEEKECQKNEDTMLDMLQNNLGTSKRAIPSHVGISLITVWRILVLTTSTLISYGAFFDDDRCLLNALLFLVFCCTMDNKHFFSTYSCPNFLSFVSSIPCQEYVFDDALLALLCIFPSSR